MLEFLIDPESPYYENELGDEEEIVFSCTVNAWSVLASQHAIMRD